MQRASWRNVLSTIVKYRCYYNTFSKKKLSLWLIWLSCNMLPQQKSHSQVDATWNDSPNLKQTKQNTSGHKKIEEQSMMILTGFFLTSCLSGFIKWFIFIVNCGLNFFSSMIFCLIHFAFKMFIFVSMPDVLCFCHFSGG